MKNIPLGLELTALGMGVVFVSLIALTLLMWLLRLASPGEKQSAATAVNPKTPPAQKPVAGISPEVVAAITAAVSAYTGMPAGSFAIHSVHPGTPSAGSAWALAGRVRQLHLAETLFKRGTSK